MSKSGFRKITRAARHHQRRGLDSALIRLVTPQPKPLILMYHRIADEPVDPRRAIHRASLQGQEWS
jgi:hypothetical protein